MERKYMNSYKAQKKSPSSELTEVGPRVVDQTYKASKLAFSDINRNRKLGLSPRSPE